MRVANSRTDMNGSCGKEELYDRSRSINVVPHTAFFKNLDLEDLILMLQKKNYFASNIGKAHIVYMTTKKPIRR